MDANNQQQPPIEYCDPVPDACLCFVCRNPVVAGVMCNARRADNTICGTLYCRQCLAPSDQCGQCGAILYEERGQIVANPAITAVADALQVRCRHRANGCDWQGQRRQLLHHCEIDCPKRPAVCTHCGRCRPFDWIAQHQPRCGHRPVQCALCGRENVQARSLAHHTQELCAFRSVEARLEALETFVRLLVQASPNLAEVGPRVEGEMLVNAQEREIAWADARDRQWEVVRVFGRRGAGEGQFDYPAVAAVDPDGRIVVTDSGGNHRIQVFSRDGAFLRQFGHHGKGDGYFHHPAGAAVDQDGSVMFADTHNHRIQVFSRDGAFLRRFGAHGNGDGQFNLPHGVTVDQEGRIVVADTFNHRIQVFSRDGRFLSQFGAHGNGDGQFNLPYGITVDQGGRIIVSDTHNHRIQVFSRDGQFLSQFGAHGNGDGQFDQPYGITVDQEGRIIAVDHVNHRLQVIRMPRAFDA